MFSHDALRWVQKDSLCELRIRPPVSTEQERSRGREEQILVGSWLRCLSLFDARSRHAFQWPSKSSQRSTKHKIQMVLH
jgi:hypothetical protein